jgi:hypothetical protein
MHAPIIYDLSGIAPDTRELILATPKYRQLFTTLPEQMLRLDGSTKVIKGNRLGFRTAILYLAPHTLSGRNMCPMAMIAACADPCLNKSGRGTMTSVQISRLRKTLFLQQYLEQAIALIKHEIALYEARSHREGWTLLVRLNGTSDRRWENDGIIQAFPNVQFYDYSKLANRKNIPTNYDLTFSYSGVPAFLPYVNIAEANGMRVAVVYRNRAMVETALANNETFLGLPIVDGDDTDIRHLDPVGVVVALYAKGTDAKNDSSGFIVG